LAGGIGGPQADQNDEREKYHETAAAEVIG